MLQVYLWQPKCFQLAGIADHDWVLKMLRLNKNTNVYQYSKVSWPSG